MATRCYDRLSAQIITAESDARFGAVFQTTLDVHSSLPELCELEGVFDTKSNWYAGGLSDQNGRNGIEIPGGKFAITPRIRSRTLERLGFLHTRPELALDDDFIRMFALAHELGHCVQHCAGFKDIYGTIDMSQVDIKYYEKYCDSDPESNADYIAARVLGQTSVFAETYGYIGPSQDPLDWRVWVKQNAIDQTISLYGHNNDLPEFESPFAGGLELFTTSLKKMLETILRRRHIAE